MALASAALPGCTFSPDPTEQFFPVSIVNDTKLPLRAQQCITESCSEFDDEGLVRPGKTFEARTSEFAVANPWRFVRRSGRVYGCLPLLFRHRVEGASVFVSHAQRCRKSYG